MGKNISYWVGQGLFGQVAVDIFWLGLLFCFGQECESFRGESYNSGLRYGEKSDESSGGTHGNIHNTNQFLNSDFLSLQEIFTRSCVLVSSVRCFWALFACSSVFSNPPSKIFFPWWQLVFFLPSDGFEVQDFLEWASGLSFSHRLLQSLELKSHRYYQILKRNEWFLPCISIF